MGSLPFQFGFSGGDQDRDPVLGNLENLESHSPDHPCMVYLPTKLGHLWGFYVGKYTIHG